MPSCENDDAHRFASRSDARAMVEADPMQVGAARRLVEMANTLYDSTWIEKNHESFVHRAEISTCRAFRTKTDTTTLNAERTAAR